MAEQWTVAHEHNALIGVFQHAAVGMALLSTSGDFLRINPAFSRLLGWTGDALPGRCRDLLHPDDLPQDGAASDGLPAGSGDDTPLELRFLHKSGAYVRTAMTRTILQGAAQPATILIQLEDRSRLHAAETEAALIRRDMAVTLENIRDGFFCLDENACFAYMNSSAERYFGRTREELLGRRIWDEFPAAKSTEVYTHYISSRDQSEPRFFEAYIPQIDAWFEFHTYPAADSFTVCFRNVTERRKTEDALREREEMYRMLADYSTDVISRHDAGGHYLYVSPACRTLLGYEPDELLGQHVSALFHPEDMPLFYQAREEIHSRLELRLATHRIRRKDGSYIWIETTGRKIRSGEAQEELLFVSRDISVRKAMEQRLRQSNERLQRISMIDALTGIPNRRCFDERYAREWEQALRLSEPLSVILLDIDYFKCYNDAYGHSEGDTCLQQVAGALSQASKRPGDFIARYGGEEFIIVLPATGADGAQAVAERLRHSVEAMRIRHGRSPASSYVTISLGIATTVPASDSSPKELLIHADQALYQAKQHGRNQAYTYATA